MNLSLKNYEISLLFKSNKKRKKRVTTTSAEKNDL